jgi:VanZ family protein
MQYNPLKSKYILTDSLIISTLLLIFLAPIDVGPKLGHFDKHVHFLVYACTSFYYLHFRKYPWIPLLGSLLCFGISMEIFQHFLPPRTFSWSDIAANSVGLMVGATLSKLYARIKSS